jgi:4-hydroxybenzoate polyprenyltransferase
VTFAAKARRVDQVARRRDWAPKIADLSLFVGFALAVSGPTPARLLTACLFLAASAARTTFGYTWNDVCDAEADAKAGKRRPLRHHSMRTAVSALVVALVLYGAAARLDPALLAIALVAVVLGWSYSAPLTRLKERGWLGLLGATLAQWTVPSAFVAVAFHLSLRSAAPWIVWLTCWGLRGEITHQVRDADSDRVAGVRTWGTRDRSRRTAYRLVALFVLVEAAALGVALLPVVRQTTVLVIALVAFPGWVLLNVGVIADVRARSDALEFIAFRRVPLADLYGVFAPLVVAVALLRLQVWPASAWVAVDAFVRVPIVLRVWRATSGLRAYSGWRPSLRASR